MLVYAYKYNHVITSALDKVFRYSLCSSLLPTPRGHYLLFTSVRFDSLLTPSHQRAAVWIQLTARNVVKHKQKINLGLSWFSRESLSEVEDAGATHPLITGTSRWQSLLLYVRAPGTKTFSSKPPSSHVASVSGSSFGELVITISLKRDPSAACSCLAPRPYFTVSWQPNLQNLTLFFGSHLNYLLFPYSVTAVSLLAPLVPTFLFLFFSVVFFLWVVLRLISPAAWDGQVLHSKWSQTKRRIEKGHISVTGRKKKQPRKNILSQAQSPNESHDQRE